MIKTEYYKDLTKMNTFGMKVKARCFMEYDSVADLVDIEFSELARPVLHIGGGSNLLFTDDFKGTVLHSKINFIEILDSASCHSSADTSATSSVGEERTPSCHSSADASATSSIGEEQTASCHSSADASATSSIGEERTPSCHSSACASATSSVGDDPASCHCEERSDVAIYVSAGAGVIFDDFCSWAAKEGLWGVENLSYIPGEVGASAVQNIGAYGVEVKDVIHKVYCYDTVEEEFVSFSVEDCGYGYRDSIFKKPEIKGRYIVTHVVFALSREPKPVLDYGHLKEAVFEASPAAGMSRTNGTSPDDVNYPQNQQQLTPALIRKVIIKIRKEKLPEPSVMGSAGSFFKNPVITLEHFRKIEAAAKAEHGPDYKVPHYIVDAPDLSRNSGAVLSASATGGETAAAVKVPAAWMIEQCGWKGRRSGGAAVYDKQPLVIVNYTGEAYPEEIISLEKRIIESVKQKFEVCLCPEVDHIFS